MKNVNAVLTPDAEPIADCFAIEKMETLVNANDDDNIIIRICNGNCLTALCLMKKNGAINNLTVTFQNGKSVLVADNGKLVHWEKDSITDTTIKLLAALAKPNNG